MAEQDEPNDSSSAGKKDAPWRFSMFGRCLAEPFTVRFKKMRKTSMNIEDHTGRRSRKFICVDIQGTSYWADAVTGTLYDKTTGVGLTGAARIV